MGKQEQDSWSNLVAPEVLRWLFPSSPHVCLVSKRAAGTAPNGVDGVPHNLLARMGPRESKSPMTFLRCVNGPVMKVPYEKSVL